MIALLLVLALQDDPAEPAVAAFKAAYRSPDEKARVEAVAELGKTRHAKVGKIIAGLLVADTPAVRKKAAEGLGGWGDAGPQVGPILLAAVKPNVKEPSVLAAIFDALGSVRYAPALEEINNKLNHADDAVSVSAIRAAGRLGSPKSMDRLLAMWNTIHEYHHPRPSAGGVSGTSGRRTPQYDRRFGMQEPEIRAAIKAISGRDFKDVVEARAWWNANRK